MPAPPGDDDDTSGSSCVDNDGDGFVSTGGGCTVGTDCSEGGAYAAFINPLAWDGPGQDGMGTHDDANCDGQINYTSALDTPLDIVPPNTDCGEPAYDFVIGSGHGDFNRDLRQDLVFGNPQAPDSVGNCNNNGRVIILSGEETQEFNATPSLYGVEAEVPLAGGATTRWTLAGPEESKTGTSVAIGQFTPGESSPSAADLLIGAPGVDIPADGGHGAVYLVLGETTPSGTCSLPACADFTFYGGSVDEAAGTTVAWAGDINQDGYQEILIGAPGYTTEDSDGNPQQEGKVYLLDGHRVHELMTASPLPATCTGPTGNAEANCYNLWELSSGYMGISITGEPGDELGKVAPATGELDGTGRPDLVLSSNVGGAYVFYGDNITQGSTTITLHIGGIEDGSVYSANRRITHDSPANHFGAAVALIPDLGVDTDLYPELAIGAPGTAAQDGAVHIISSDEINNAGVWGTVNATTTSIVLTGKPGSGERFGKVLAGGNLDGDSHGDLVVCAPHGGPPLSSTSGSGAGAARLYRGATIDSLYNTNPLVAITTNDADVAFMGEVPDNPQRDGDRFCSSLNISSDVDAAPNDHNELIVAAPDWEDPNCNGANCGFRGKAYVYANPYTEPGMSNGQP